MNPIVNFVCAFTKYKFDQKNCFLNRFTQSGRGYKFKCLSKNPKQITYEYYYFMN